MQYTTIQLFVCFSGEVQNVLFLPNYLSGSIIIYLVDTYTNNIDYNTLNFPAAS